MLCQSWKSLLWVQDNGLLHLWHFLGPDHLVRFSAWLPFPGEWKKLIPRFPIPLGIEIEIPHFPHSWRKTISWGFENSNCDYRIMNYYTFDTSLGQTILSNFLHGFHSPRISQVLKYCLDFQSSTYYPLYSAWIWHNWCSKFFYLKMPYVGAYFTSFFPFKIMDVLQVEKFQGQA